MRLLLILAIAVGMSIGCGDDPKQTADVPLVDVAGPTDVGTNLDDAGAKDGQNGDAVTSPPVDLDLSVPLEKDQARAGIIDDVNELLTGPKVEGRLGDIKMYNSHAAFVIESVRRSGGYRYWGGHPVDVAAIVDGVPLPDTYGEFFRSWNFTVFQPETVS